jgi:glyoxylase-like metal-dependent hydrolase (beta-lactamase superfamily II)
MTLVRSVRVGSLVCHALDGGRVGLDGGAMFGVVPKPLWERRIPADAKNRIPLALRCLLIEHDDGLILVDTGIGNKDDEKFRAIYDVQNEGTAGPTRLEDAIREAGHAPEDVAWVINTHLHFDHCGGNAVLGAARNDAQGAGSKAQGARCKEQGDVAGPSPVRLAFPNATYVVQRRELDFATHTNERTAGSYLRQNMTPVTAAGRWKLVDGPTDLFPGISLLPTPGHVPYHQSVVIRSGGETACFVADLIPTAAHVPLPWIMGYDLEPLVTLETKRAFLSRADADGWLLVLEHEPGEGIGRVVRDGKGYQFDPLDSAALAG